METDWVGLTNFIVDRDSGEKVKANMFVATLPCSQISNAEASLSMNLHAWVTAHNHAYDCFGGVTQLVVQDNPKTIVIKHTAKDLVLDPTFRERSGKSFYYILLYCHIHCSTQRL